MTAAPGGRRSKPLTLPFAALLVALSPAVRAQGAPPPVPDAGAILQQIQPPRPPAAAPAPGLRIEQDSGASAPAGPAFEVKTLRISGNTVFASSVLHALIADAEGRRLTLAELLALAGRITDQYRSHGYPLARALIRAQVIRDGVVDIEVLEARYGRIELGNRSRVDDALLRATLAPLQSGQLVSQAELDRALLLLADIPGVVVDATLRPGASVGASDLQVDAAPGPFLAGAVVADNHGNRYTGRARAGASVDLFNPLQRGDVLSANLLDSGPGLAYARLSYEALLDGAGTRAGASYSYLRYSLRGSLESLDVNGTARVASVWAKRPLLRSRDSSVYAQLRIERLDLRDRIDATAIRTDRHLDTLGLGLTGDARDALLGGGLATWTLGWTTGRVGLRDAAAKAADAASAGTQGGFSRWHAALTRLQGLGPQDALYLAVSGQWAPGNLDSSQKMSVGGPYSVRAYDIGALSGDVGVLATAEWRHAIAAANGRWQLAAFADSATLRINQSPWTAGRNRATLSGVGIGVDWAGPSRWQVKAYVATSLGKRPELLGAGTAATRAWVEVRKSF